MEEGVVPKSSSRGERVGTAAWLILGGGATIVLRAAGAALSGLVELY